MTAIRDMAVIAVDVPAAQQNVIGQALTAIIAVNLPQVTTPVTDAVIRRGSYYYSAVEDGQLHSASFIIDVPSLEVSFSAASRWFTSVSGSQPPPVFGDGDTGVGCPQPIDMVYPPFPCINVANPVPSGTPVPLAEIGVVGSANAPTVLQNWDSLWSISVPRAPDDVRGAIERELTRIVLLNGGSGPSTTDAAVMPDYYFQATDADGFAFQAMIGVAIPSLGQDFTVEVYWIPSLSQGTVNITCMAPADPIASPSTCVNLS
jgi:hypothetical protein